MGSEGRLKDSRLRSFGIFPHAIGNAGLLFMILMDPDLCKGDSQVSQEHRRQGASEIIPDEEVTPNLWFSCQVRQTFCGMTLRRRRLPQGSGKRINATRTTHGHKVVQQSHESIRSSRVHVASQQHVLHVGA
jgi:hypothetical protein